MRVLGLLFLLWIVASMAAGRPDAPAACAALIEALERPIRILQGGAEGVWLRSTELQLERALQIAAGDFDDLGPEERPFAPVWKLPLSVRTRHKLEKVGIRRVGDLTALTAEALADVSRGEARVGQMAAEEVAKLLARYDLALRTKRTDLVVRAATAQDAVRMAEMDKRHSVENFRDYFARGASAWVAESDGKVVAFIVIAHSQTIDGKACVDTIEDDVLASELRVLEPRLFCVVQLGAPARLGHQALTSIYDQIFASYPDAHFVAQFSEHLPFDREIKFIHSQQGFLRFSPEGIYVRLAN